MQKVVPTSTPSNSVLLFVYIDNKAQYTTSDAQNATARGNLLVVVTQEDQCSK